MRPLRLRLRRRLTATALVVALAAGIAPGAAAAVDAPTADPTTTRAELQEDLAEATDEELRLGRALAAAESERARLAAELATVEARVATAVDALVEGEVALGRATAGQSGAEARLRASEAELDLALAELREQAVASFIGGRGASPLGVLGTPRDVRELAAASTYRDVVVEHQDGVVDEVARLRRARERELGRAEAARAAAGAAVREAASRRRAVEVERATLAELEASAGAAVAAESGLLDDVRVRKATYEATLAELVALSGSLAEALAAHQAGQVAVPAERGTFSLPVPTARLSSRFGPRVHPVFGTSRLHAGMDLAAPTGTPVAVARPGTVVGARVMGGYGKAVVVDHGAGLSTLYAHLSTIDVGVGDVLAAGQVLGRVGSTGLSTGPHLHFEVRVLGAPVDPLGYL